MRKTKLSFLISTLNLVSIYDFVLTSRFKGVIFFFDKNVITTEKTLKTQLIYEKPKDHIVQKIISTLENDTGNV